MKKTDDLIELFLALCIAATVFSGCRQVFSATSTFCEILNNDLKVKEETFLKELDSCEVLIKENKKKEEAIVEEVVENSNGKKRKVTATFYHPVKGQCSGNPLITASGSKIDLKKLENGDIKWIAVSNDLLTEFGGFGTRVRITCLSDPSIDGIYYIKDSMHSRWRNKIDLLWSPNKTSKRGVWKDVSIAKI